jgi:hypothetical protein
MWARPPISGPAGLRRCCRRLARRALLSDNPVTRRFYRIILLERVNWVWGLSLIALTIAIHAMGVVMLAVVGLGGFRARLETRKR